MNLRLIRPTIEDKDRALEFKQEFFIHDEHVINGSEMLDNINSYEDWFASVKKNESEETVHPDWVVTDTFWAVDEENDIVGIIDFRHELKGFLVDFGHSGYSVRPSERRKGYATKMLGLLKQYAKECGLNELQLSVERSNAPSIKTIVSNGGVFVRSFEFEGETADVYKISLTV